MMDRIKQAAMNQAMKLMSDPRVSKFLSDPRVMKLLTKGFELQGKIKEQVKSKIQFLAELLNLAPKNQ